MKVNYKPTGTSRQNSPKQWEVWLADAPFGGTKKRCAVVVDKRTPAGYTVYEVISLSLKVEEAFSVTIPEEQYARCATVAGLTDLICEMKGL